MPNHDTIFRGVILGDGCTKQIKDPGDPILFLHLIHELRKYLQQKLPSRPNGQNRKARTRRSLMPLIGLRRILIGRKR